MRERWVVLDLCDPVELKKKRDIREEKERKEKKQKKENTYI
jgi:hypothetical protein